MTSQSTNTRPHSAHRSPVLADGWQIQLHRDTYIGVLRGRLSQPGAKQDFAARVGITPQYLSYLLDPYNHRTPSPDLARAIAQALHMSDHERNHLLEHLLYANERQQSSYHQLHTRARQDKVEPEEVKQQTVELKALYNQAKYNDDPNEMRQQIAAVGQSARTLLGGLNPWSAPVDYADIALLMHDLNTAVAHPSQALYYAKLARAVLNMAEPNITHAYGLQYHHALTNSIRSEAVSSYNLGLLQEAYVLLLETEKTPDAVARPAFWLPHIYRDRLATLSMMRRFAIGEAEGLATQGVERCEELGTELAPLLTIFLERHLAEIYLRRERMQDAEGLLRRLVDEMRHVKLGGVRHQIPVLMDFARMLWRQRAVDEWQAVMVEVVTLMAQAGMDNGIQKLRRRYLNAMDAVWDQVESKVAPPAYGDQ